MRAWPCLSQPSGHACQCAASSSLLLFSSKALLGGPLQFCKHLVTARALSFFLRFCPHPANTGQKLKVVVVFRLGPSLSHLSYVTLVTEECDEGPAFKVGGAFAFPRGINMNQAVFLEPSVPGTCDIYCSFCPRLKITSNKQGKKNG